MFKSGIVQKNVLTLKIGLLNQLDFGLKLQTVYTRNPSNVKPLIEKQSDILISTFHYPVFMRNLK